MATLIDIPAPNGWELAMVFNVLITSTDGSKIPNCIYKNFREDLLVKSPTSNVWIIGGSKWDTSRSITAKCRFITQHMRKSGTAQGLILSVQMDVRTGPTTVMGDGIGINVPKSTSVYTTSREPERTVDLHYGDQIWAPGGHFTTSADVASGTVLLYLKQ